jgi:DNA-binding Xre family transcriptional regulator
MAGGNTLRFRATQGGCLSGGVAGNRAHRRTAFGRRGERLPASEQMARRSKAFSDLSEEVRKRPGAAAEIDARKRAIVAAVRLNELRQHRGQTQAQLAELLGMTQANVSRIERSDNLYLSTLADYVGALGGHIEINAVFDDDVVALGPVEKDRSEMPA